MPNAARVTDTHVCPGSTLAVPHVGGTILDPGAVRSVMIGGLPAAVEGTTCACPGGPPNTIAKGSTSVVIAHKGAARMGDPTTHAGMVIGGCTTVLIG